VDAVQGLAELAGSRVPLLPEIPEGVRRRSRPVGVDEGRLCSCSMARRCGSLAGEPPMVIISGTTPSLIAGDAIADVVDGVAASLRLAT
jgi:hypothetical protein